MLGSGSLFPGLRRQCRVYQSRKALRKFISTDGPCAEARKVLRFLLAIDEGHAQSLEDRHQVDQRNLRSVALAGEHRFAEEYVADGDPIQAADQPVLFPGLDGVRVT